MVRTASPGPPPKNPATRRRTNTPTGELTGITEIASSGLRARPFNQKWSEAIKALYHSICASHVPKDQTDLDFAWILLDTLHHALTHPNLASNQISASLVNSCIGNLARLGVCATDRARMGIILKETAEISDQKIAIFADYKKLRDSTEAV
jgi:hypothetical protein